MQVFLDANIYLSFYHLSDDDLVELENLVRLVKDSEMHLWIPEHIEAEVRRNRANKIKDGIADFAKAKFRVPAPSYVRAMDDYRSFSAALHAAENEHAKLYDEVRRQVEKNELKADVLIEQLFDVGSTIALLSSVATRAEARMQLGNPPGKPSSFGDRLHWECLLNQFQGYRPDLSIVSDDGDFASPLDNNCIDEFLLLEWREVGNHPGELKLFRKLSDFLRTSGRNINLRDEDEKDALIGNLAVSPNFASTHSIVAQLSKYEQFTQRQAGELFEILQSNTQVSWIVDDEDILSFFSNICNTHDYLFLFDHKYDEAERLIEAAKAGGKDSAL